MPLALDNFLHSLCMFLAAQLSLNYAQSGSNDLFRYEAKEGFANDPYTVISPAGGGGDTLFSSTPVIGCQVMTRATGNAAGIVRAQAIFDTLLGSDGRPLRMTTIPGYAAPGNTASGHWLLRNVDWTQRPGVIGRDDRGRIGIAFNWTMGLNPTA
jgi:hypothetical protein